MPGHVGGAPVLEHDLVLPKEFWALIKMGDDLQKDCWEWQGLKWKSGGYGRWNQHNWGYWVHRVTFAQYRGPIPEIDGKSAVIDHLCMNKVCCNPYHLDPTTSQDNVRRWSEQTIKTCAKGHPLTRENTDGRSRRCKICHRDRERERQRTKRAAGIKPKPGRSGRPINTKTKLGYAIAASGLRTYEVSALTGVYTTALSSYIRGGDIAVKHLAALCDLFDCEPEDIVGFRTPAQPGGDRNTDRQPDGTTRNSNGGVRRPEERSGPSGRGLQDRVRPAESPPRIVEDPDHSGPQRLPSNPQRGRPARSPGSSRSDVRLREGSDAVDQGQALGGPDPLTVDRSADLDADREFMCQAKTPACTGRAAHSHHRKTKARGGSNNPVNLVRVCASCHDFIHAHPKEAAERGFLLHAFDREAPLTRLW